MKKIKQKIKNLWNFKNNLKSLTYKNKYPILDVLKTYATIYVTVYHYQTYWILFNKEESSIYIHQKFSNSILYKVFENGDLGVDIFSFISGFLIYNNLLQIYKENNNTFNFKNYMIFIFKRLIRLLPSYLIAILLWIIIPPLNLSTVPNQSTNCKNWIWTNLLFVNNIYSTNTPCLPVSWSLALDLQFYLLSPLIFILMLKFKNGYIIPIILILLNIIVTITLFVFNQNEYWDDIGGDLIYNKIYTRSGPYFVGMVLYHFMENQNQFIKIKNINNFKIDNHIYVFLKNYKVRYFLNIIFAILFLTIGFLYPHGNKKLSLITNILFIGFSRIIYVLSISYYVYIINLDFFDSSDKIISSYLCTIFSKLSYNIFLLHFIGLILVMFIKYDENMNSLKTFLILLTASFIGLLSCLILSLFIYLFIEKPFTNIIKLKKNKIK